MTSLQAPGKIFVSNDEWTTSDTGFSVAPAGATAQFVKNLASWFTEGRQGNFLAYTTNGLYIGSQIGAALTGEGHSWTVSTGVDFSMPNLQQYDGIFVGGDAANNSVLIDYVKRGGNVYLAGGTGGNAAAEANYWALFLNAFGLSYASAYNGIIGNIAITSSHPVFNGVSHLYQNNGSDVFVLDSADPRTQILQFYSSIHGLYGVYDNTLPKHTGPADCGCSVHAASDAHTVA
jgi:hypothetical protein